MLYVVLGGSALTSQLSPNGDNASYIVLAQSLVEGNGYVNTIFPGNPVETQYPPLLPLLLTPVIWAFGKNYLLLKLIPFVFGGLSLIVIFRFFCVHSGEKYASMVVLLTAINASFLNLSTDILTETLYLFLSVFSLYSVHRIATSATDFREWIIAGLLIAGAFYARTIGVSLAAGSIVFLVYKRQIKPAFTIAGVLVVLMGVWALRSAIVPNSYFYQLSENSSALAESGRWIWVGRLIHNIPRYVGKVAADLIGGPAIGSLSPYSPIKITASSILSGLFALGFLRQGFRHPDVSIFYLVFYLGILAVWPYHDARFLVPILPFILFYMLQGIQALGERWPSIGLQKAVVVFGVCGVITSLYQTYYDQTRFYSPEMANYRTVSLWLKDHTPPQALIICRKPRITALWAERKTWWYSDPLSLPEFKEKGRVVRPTHLIITDFPIAGVNLADHFAPVLQAHPERFRRIFQTAPPSVSVYELLSP